jgi:hypothetical protein
MDILDGVACHSCKPGILKTAGAASKPSRSLHSFDQTGSPYSSAELQNQPAKGLHASVGQ